MTGAAIAALVVPANPGHTGITGSRRDLYTAPDKPADPGRDEAELTAMLRARS